MCLHEGVFFLCIRQRNNTSATTKHHKVMYGMFSARNLRRGYLTYDCIISLMACPITGIVQVLSV